MHTFDHSQEKTASTVTKSFIITPCKWKKCKQVLQHCALCRHLLPGKVLVHSVTKQLANE